MTDLRKVVFTNSLNKKSNAEIRITTHQKSYIELIEIETKNPSDLAILLSYNYTSILKNKTNNSSTIHLYNFRSKMKLQNNLYILNLKNPFIQLHRDDIQYDDFFIQLQNINGTIQDFTVTMYITQSETPVLKKWDY